MKPPKRIQMHWQNGRWGQSYYCTNGCLHIWYILLSEHEKQLAEKDRMLAAMAKRLPIPKNVKIVKFLKGE